MLDIGWGELLLIAVLALLVFGPEKLPKVAADAARTLRQVRRMATEARRDLADAAGLQEDQELAATMRDLRSLDPRRVLDPLEEAAPRAPRPGAPGATTPAPGATNQAPPATGLGPASVGPPEKAAPGPVQPPAPTPVDPDWT
ncbi:MAG TPA: Sec-independent protein translocase protein TatB [Candidatus Nanopelagicales bacterium]